MRAVGINRFGGPEVLEVVELPTEDPGEGQVRVRVAAAAVNPTDTVLRAGFRSEMYDGVERPLVPGMELAGIIDAVGPGAAWEVGDEVVAIVVPGPRGRGAQAEEVVVPAASLARLPAGASFAEGATLPMNGLTARVALDVLHLRPGETLAVTGAAGAVGGYVIELAKLDGLRVVGDAADADRELVARLGADVVVPRGDGVASAIRGACPDGVDGLVDAALLNQKILAAVRDGGAIAAVRPFQGETERGISVHLVLVADHATDSDALAELSRLASEKKLTLRVAKTYPPEQAAEAHRALEAGGVRGRNVIVF
ncbi:MAG TPA: NADP-dependent oxidoreductase [Acidimicrobiales bacterium]|nr:NADP-dependent oxidoreductase [Acidimicrobiales bacterium]